MRHGRYWSSKRSQCAMLWLIACGAAWIARPMNAQSQNTDRWSKLYAANDLDTEGSKPFHLKMTFQLYSMAGGKADAGTIEEWWYSPKDHHTLVHSPAFNRDSNTPSAYDQNTERENYLVNELLNFTLRPVPKHDSSRASDINEKTLSFGKVTLDCFEAKPTSLPGSRQNPPTICAQQNSDEVRVVLESEGNAVSTRNSMGKFRGIAVALNVEVSLVGRDAIVGKVETLEGLDPKPTEATAPTATADPGPITNPSSPSRGATDGLPKVGIAAGVVAGFRTKFVQPNYPLQAKLARMSGTVVLKAVISKEGKVEHLVPIAITDGVFTDAAMEAVKQWEYKPYLLNGEPTDVDTTITVNFQMSH